ncbi:MAG: hypothetical protein HQ558_05490 [Candidatus Omnitrophica bacterium]|nr:hypothetical protein [Candidatus Omnitrophota bacterium]
MMNWKLFGQVVLLIFIAALILTGMKICKKRGGFLCKSGSKQGAVVKDGPKTVTCTTNFGPKK